MVLFKQCAFLQHTLNTLDFFQTQPIKSTNNHIPTRIKVLTNTNNICSHTYIEWVNVSIYHSFLDETCYLNYSPLLMLMALCDVIYGCINQWMLAHSG